MGTQQTKGDIEAEHTATRTRSIAAILLFMLPGAGLFALAAQYTGEGAGQRLAGLTSGVMLVVLGVLAFVHQRKLKVVLRADGIELWGLRGQRWALRWSEMTTLHVSVVKDSLSGLLGFLVPSSIYFYIAVTDASGKRRTVPVNMKNMDILAERIIEQHTTAHFATARSKIDAGEELRFGKKVALNRETISIGKFFGGMKSCPLAEVERVMVEFGGSGDLGWLSRRSMLALSIRQKGKTFASVQTGAIPNVALLLRLLDSMLDCAVGELMPGLGAGRAAARAGRDRAGGTVEGRRRRKAGRAARTGDKSPPAP
ncbi:DUF6585 family protein [Sorangium sp. So ce542]|uniref:DUF6585 family protein n=1 Tax=Sorangium sp. So ce542 TaxID=3133316 RepID=UPI003F5D8BB4